MPSGYVFSEKDYLTLKRDHYALQRQLTNLRQSVTKGQVRKHQGGRLPPARQVQIWSTSGSPAVGALLAANGDGLHPGRIRILTDSTWSSDHDVWIRLTDWEADAGAVIGEHGRYFVGTLSGTFSSGGTNKPLYLCQTGEQAFVGQADSTITKGNPGTPGTVSIYHGSPATDSGINLTAIALGATVTSGKWCTVCRVRNGNIYAIPWEC